MTNEGGQMATKDESTLTDRQREVLKLARKDDGGEGLSTQEIADRLNITYNGANEHVRNLRKKGFLPKANGRRPSRTGPRPEPTPRETPTPVATSENGRVGYVVVETLRRAIEEADEAIEAGKREMAVLSQKQHDVAEETEKLANLRTDLDQQVKTLA